MKKLLTALLATVLLVQTCTVAFAAEIDFTEANGLVEVTVTTDAEDEIADGQVSLVGFVGAQMVEEDKADADFITGADYLNQVVSEDGVVTAKMYIAKTDENFLDGQYINVFLNGNLFQEEIEIGGGEPGDTISKINIVGVPSSIVIAKKQKVEVKVTTDNDDFDVATLDWESSRPEIADVSIDEDGVATIIGIKAGLAVIKITGPGEDGDVVRQIVVQVR